MSGRILKLAPETSCRLLVGVGGIGTGLFFALEGNQTLGRNESRPARQLDVRDYCKLHIITHYVALLLGARSTGAPFHVLPIGKVGDDAAGQRLRQEMTESGMDTRLVDTIPEQPTLLSICFQYPDGTGGNITPSDSANSSLRTPDLDRAASLLASNNGRCMALAAPEVQMEIRHHLLKLATAQRAFRVASFTRAEVAVAIERGMFSLVDLVALNEEEAAVLAGSPFDPTKPEPFLRSCADSLTNIQPRINILVTAGKEGAYAFADGNWDHCPSPTVTVASTAGAGDALLGGVIAALAAGIPLTKGGPLRKTIQDRPLNSALDFGVMLAALSITSSHTIHPTANLDVVLEFASQLGITFSEEVSRLFQPAGGERFP